MNLCISKMLCIMNNDFNVKKLFLCNSIIIDQIYKINIYMFDINLFMIKKKIKIEMNNKKYKKRK